MTSMNAWKGFRMNWTSEMPGSPRPGRGCPPWKGEMKLFISKKVQFQTLGTQDISKWNHHFLEASTFNVVWAAKNLMPPYSPP